MNYKRVIVINSQSMYKDNATGITLLSILGDYPQDKLLELHIGRESENKQDDSISSICVMKCFPLRNVVEKKKNSISKVGNKSMENPSFKLKVKNRIRRILINIADCSPMLLNKEVSRRIDEFQPEVIYTLGGAVGTMKLVHYVAKNYRIPVVMHFMDDWKHYLQDNKGITQFLYKKQLDKWLRICYMHSKIALAISPQMAACYEGETSIKHIPLMNAVDTERLYCAPKEKTDEFVFTYAGGLHLNRWKALVELSEAVEKVSLKIGVSARLVIYTKLSEARDIISLFNPNVCEFREYVPHDEIKRVYEETDALLHVEVSNPLLIEYFRFSISTKIPEYLSSNRPMLFYGPSQIGLYHYLKDNRCAYVAGERKELEEQLVKIICGNGEDGVLENAQKIAHENHRLDNTRRIFADVINSSCDKSQ